MDALLEALAQATDNAIATHRTSDAIDADPEATVDARWRAWDIAVTAEMARYDAWLAVQAQITEQSLWNRLAA